MEKFRFNKWFIPAFASAWSGFFMVYISFVTFGAVPPANVRFVDIVLGFLLGTVASTVINYFFGSSDSSKTKDDTIREISK